MNAKDSNEIIRRYRLEAPVPLAMDFILSEHAMLPAFEYSGLQ